MSNYQIQSGTLLESFDTIGDWTGGGTGGGAISIDTSIVRTGTTSLKIDSVNGNYYATKTINIDMSRAGIFSVDVYFDDITKSTQGSIYLSSTTDLSKYFSVTLRDLRQGWNKIFIHKNLWAASGGETWTTMIRLRVRLDATDTTSAYFDNIRYGVYNRPKVVFTCDDGWDSQFDELYTYTKDLYPDFKATLFVIGDYVETASLNYMTKAQLTEMYNAGWDICSHTYNHTNLTTLGTQAEMETELALMKTWLSDNGYTRNNMLKHFCYPNGGHDTTTMAAVEAQGIVTARTVIASGGRYQTTGDRLDLLVVRNLGNTTVLADIKTDVDQAIASGCTLVIESHKFVATPVASTEFAISDMQALVDYIMKKHYGGELDVVPMTEWYNGLTNPRKLA